MAITPPLSSAQPSATTNVRKPNAPRFAGGPSASGANTPPQDIFTRSDGAVDVDAILAKSAADIGNVDDLLAMLNAKATASPANEANPFASLQQTQTKFDEENPYTAPIEDQTLALAKIEARKAQLAKWGPLAPAYKFFNPATVDGEDQETKLTLQGMKDRGISMQDLFKTEKDIARQEHQDEFAAIQKRLKEQSKAEIRTALQGSMPDEEIEARIEQMFKDSEPEIDQEFQRQGLNADDIQQIKQKTQKPTPEPTE